MAIEIIDNSASFTREPEVEVAPTHASFEPINTFVLVKRVQEDNSMKGSIHVPDKFIQKSNKGTVRSLGHKVTANVKANDIIIFGAYNAEDLVINGEELILVNESDIRGVERAL